jgi:hypothetical protein
LISPLRPILAVPIIALLNAVLMGLGDRAYKQIVDSHSAIQWPDSFWILFWYTLIFASTTGLALAPIMVWAGARIPQPKPRYLLGIGLIVGPLPFVLLEGLSGSSLTGLAAFSLLGGTSAIAWWHLVEKHRTVLESKNV